MKTAKIKKKLNQNTEETNTKQNKGTGQPKGLTLKTAENYTGQYPQGEGAYGHKEF